MESKDRSDLAQEMLLKKLEDSDWDLSLDALDELAEDLSELFGSEDAAKEFVESHASSLYDMMEATADRRSDSRAKRPPLPFEHDQE